MLLSIVSSLSFVRFLITIGWFDLFFGFMGFYCFCLLLVLDLVIWNLVQLYRNSEVVLILDLMKCGLV